LYGTAIAALTAPAAIAVYWLLTYTPPAAQASPAVSVVTPDASDPESAAPDPLAELAARDPMALARLALERYERGVHDYRCVFVKQERLDGKLRPVEQIAVQYRENPCSVYMTWLRNADRVRRALFIDNPKYVDADGHKLVRIEPAGAIARLFVSEVLLEVDGPEARESSRRRIDEFGFKSVLTLLLKYNEVARQRGVLKLHYGGTGEIDGQSTYVLIRDLPYEGPDGPYPDARMVLHLDRQTLLPLAVFSYADHEGKKLLGSYVHTQVELNPGLTDTAFQF